MTRNEFNTLIQREDNVGMHAIGRALVYLFNRQTEDEKMESTTKHHNNRGFTGADGRRGVITAKYFLKHKKLLDWQIEYWLERDRRGTTRLGKYYGQILEEVRKKK
jgi:hypothetical protein